MRHRPLSALALLLALLLLAACGQGAGKPGPTPDSPQQAAAMQSVSPIPDAALKAGWPADLAPRELPEYTSGTVTASALDGGGALTIRVTDTGKSDLDAYLDSLRSGGWIVTSGDSEAEAVLGLYTVRFDLQGGGSALQIDVYTAEAGVWPAAEIPPDVLEPRTGALAEQVEVLETGDELWYFNYTCDGIDEAAAQDYMELLMENGWSGDVFQVYKSFEWKGDSYEASIEIYETLETRTTFTCNFYRS